MQKVTPIQSARTKKVELSKPYSFEDKEYTKLELDFDSLTGQDVINAEKKVRALGDSSPVAEFSKTYQAVVAAKAAKVPVDLIMKLPAKDFTRITILVQNFLLEEV